MSGITAKMHKALVHFSEHGNKSAAYRHAYDVDNMKDSTITRKAQELFDHPLIKMAVDQMQIVAVERININAAWVLKRAALLADFNINKFIVIKHGGNAYYDFSTATDDDWYCISEYTVDQLTKGFGDDKYDVERVKVKGHCKLKALELVGRHVEVQAFKESQNINAVVFNISTDEYIEARRKVIEQDDC